MRILDIESKIKDIEHDQDFLRLRGQIKILETARRGPSILLVSDPDKMSSVIELRRNSASVEEYLVKYRLMAQGKLAQVEQLKAEIHKLKADMHTV